MDRLRERYAGPLETEIDLSEVPADTWPSHERARASAAGGRARAAAGRRTRRADAVLSRGSDARRHRRSPEGSGGNGQIASLSRPPDVARSDGRWRFTHHDTSHSPAALAGELRRLTVLELSRSARAGYVCLLLAASAMTAVVGGLLLTEPSLPRHTSIALAVMVAIGLSWVCFAAWVLTPETDPAGQGPDRRRPPGRYLQQPVRRRLRASGGDHRRGVRIRGDGAGPGDARRGRGAVDSCQAAVRTTDQEAAAARARARSALALIRNIACQGRRQKAKGRTSGSTAQTENSPFCLIPSALSLLPYPFSLFPCRWHFLTPEAPQGRNHAGNPQHEQHALDGNHPDRCSARGVRPRQALQLVE